MERDPRPKQEPLPEFDPATVHIYKVGDEVTWPKSAHPEDILTITDILAVPTGERKFTGHSQKVKLKDSIGPFSCWITAAHLLPVEKEEEVV